MQIEILDDGFISNSTEALTLVVTIKGVKETEKHFPPTHSELLKTLICLLAR